MSLLVTETSHGVSIYNFDNVVKSRYFPIPKGECDSSEVTRCYCDTLGIHPDIYDNSGDSISKLLADNGKRTVLMEVGDHLSLLENNGDSLFDVKCDELFFRGVAVLFKEVSDAEKLFGRNPMTNRQSMKLNRFLVGIFSTATCHVDSFCSPFWGSANLDSINSSDTFEQDDLYKIWTVSETAQKSMRETLARAASGVAGDFDLTSDNCLIAITNYYLREAFEEALGSEN